MTRSKIRTSGADGLTLSSTDITIDSGDLLFGTSAKGVNLGVTSNTDGNTLDDYEEGTFTPAFDFLSSSPSAGATVGQGVYTKIGRLVTLHIRLVNVNSDGATGDVTVTGLPFTSLPDDGGNGAVTVYIGVCRINSVNVAAEYISAEIIDNVAVARIIENVDNSSIDLINAGNISHASSDFHITLTYPTA